MNRLEAIHQLQRHADAVKGMGASALYLFGSTARDEAQATSDIDLFIDYEPDRPTIAFAASHKNVIDLPHESETRPRPAR